MKGVWLAALTLAPLALAQERFAWPEGKRAAVSFSFDDARASQLTNGMPLLERLKVKGTFLVSPRAIARRPEEWKKAAAAGHDIGSHTTSHACTGNYSFSVRRALEDFDLARMESDIDNSIAEIKRILGITPVSFAYPCGQKFVGRGVQTRSYVPLVAARFLVGRGYLDEAANDPRRCDLAQAMGTAIDNMTPEQVTALVRKAADEGRWIVLVSHEVGSTGDLVTSPAAIEAVVAMAKDPANGLWLDTVAAVARHIDQSRRKP